MNPADASFDDNIEDFLANLAAQGNSDSGQQSKDSNSSDEDDYNPWGAAEP